VTYLQQSALFRQVGAIAKPLGLRLNKFAAVKPIRVEDKLLALVNLDYENDTLRIDIGRVVALQADETMAAGVS